ncbi:MAG: geranylgeranylglycerol-phosphate geranylgeranyltransferase [Desulfurococcales archaeon]|nr:geranylgeranylglycerol-phosphate geranylgeranyltransferase [Desulfurococcales archaeon]
MAAAAALGRPLNSAMMGFAVIVGASLATGGSPWSAGWDRLLAGFLTGFFYTMASMAHNDIIDYGVDRVNAPWRPLPSGSISVRGAWAAFAAYLASGLASSLYLGPLEATAAALALALALAYNRWGKRSGLPGNAMVAFITSFPIIYGGLIASRLTASLAAFWIVVFLAVLGREVAKGIPDVEGDSMAGVRTLAVTAGPRAAAVAASIAYVSAVAASAVPLFYGGVNRAVYLATVGPVAAGFIVESLTLVRSYSSKDRVLSHKRRILYLMLAGLVGFQLSVMV